MNACRRCDWQPDPDSDLDAQAADHGRESGHWRCPACGKSLGEFDGAHGCEQCLSQAQGDLASVVFLFAELPTHLGHLHGSLGGSPGNDGHPLPGGTVLALLADGSEGLAEDDWTTKAGDPPSIAYEIAWWAMAVMDERNESVELGHRPAVQVRNAARYLQGHLRWAAVTFQGFPDLARDLSVWHRALEAATGRTEPQERAAAPCLSCSGDLVREITDKGRADDWSCRRCGRVLTDAEYHLACRAAYEEHQEWMLVAEAARRLGLSRQVINGWAVKKFVPSKMDDAGRRVVRWEETRQRAAEWAAVAS